MQSRDALHGGSRRALLWCLVAFAIVQLGLAGLAHFEFHGLRDPHYAPKAERLEERIRALEPQADRVPIVVMLGSSRTVHGFIGTAVEADIRARLGRQAIAFNFGQPGAGP